MPTKTTNADPSWEPEGWASPASTAVRPAPAVGWLSDGDLAVIRAQMPVVYINALPVRLDDTGDVLEVGLLLRIGSQGLTRALVSGRVLYHERVRDAIKRHMEADLGAMSLPMVPPSPQPFTVAEYLPTPGITPFSDPRQHAVALAYVVPVAGDCQPRQDAVQMDWLTPEEALLPEVTGSFTGGQHALVRQALAYLGRLA